FVCAAQERLERLCDTGRLRADLAARLDGFSYHLRPLRGRLEDLGTCAAAILLRQRSKVTRIQPDAAHRLLGYAWPANMRELEQCLTRAVALADGDIVRTRDLPAALR